MKNLSKEKLMKETKGITLVALVVTIIVLIILATITIGRLSADNSVLTQSKTARSNTRYSEELEKVQLAIYNAVTNGYNKIATTLTIGEVKAALGEYFDDAETKTTEDGASGWKYTGEYGTYSISTTGVVTGTQTNN